MFDLAGAKSQKAKKKKKTEIKYIFVTISM